VQAEKDKQAAEDEKNRKVLKFNLRKADLLLHGLKQDEFGNFCHQGKTLVGIRTIEDFSDEGWSERVAGIPGRIEQINNDLEEDKELARQQKVLSRHLTMKANSTSIDADGHYFWGDAHLISSDDVDSLSDDAWMAMLSDIVSRVGKYKADAEEEKERIRVEALKPDQDKLCALINKLRVECSKVKLNTEPGKEIVDLILADLDRNEEAILNLK
jgi:hypothetical protein